ncbi:MAG: hypothetical protein K8H88_12010 [Sandaracinaceae bacterium]|nr:hypothetical protein [Sandaracinaceae bacterium]
MQIISRHAAFATTTAGNGFGLTLLATDARAHVDRGGTRLRAAVQRSRIHKLDRLLGDGNRNRSGPRETWIISNT